MSEDKQQPQPATVIAGVRTKGPKRGHGAGAVPKGIVARAEGGTDPIEAILEQQPPTTAQQHPPAALHAPPPHAARTPPHVSPRHNIHQPQFR